MKNNLIKILIVIIVALTATITTTVAAVNAANKITAAKTEIAALEAAKAEVALDATKFCICSLYSWTADTAELFGLYDGQIVWLINGITVEDCNAKIVFKNNGAVGYETAASLEKDIPEWISNVIYVGLTGLFVLALTTICFMEAFVEIKDAFLMRKHYRKGFDEADLEAVEAAVEAIKVSAAAEAKFYKKIKREVEHYGSKSLKEETASLLVREAIETLANIAANEEIQIINYNYLIYLTVAIKNVEDYPSSTFFIENLREILDNMLF